MRILLNITAILLLFPAKVTAQSNFLKLDRQSYEYYMRGDLKNLKITADSLLSQGTDYYYLRMRLGILSYDKAYYPIAVHQLSKALEFNSLDTISREYIYMSYLLSGRKADAGLYLESLPPDKKNNTLKIRGESKSSEFYFRSSVAGYDVTTYQTNNLYYEALKTGFSISAGYETFFNHRLKGTFAYTNYRKSGTGYSSSFPMGTNLNFSQNQFYAKLSGYAFPGWEFSGFGHAAFYNDASLNNQLINEYLGGINISKSGWKIRSGAGISVSNFGNSNQIRGEGFVTFLPMGNLNIYFTTGGMYQSDRSWGNTYQINQEIGFKISDSFWFESGIVKGNSFLFARNMGSAMSNSFLIPATTIYGSVIILPEKKFSFTLSPFYSRNEAYSWDLKAYTRTGKLIHDSFGVSLKIIYKYK
jgi:hypothetical protein